MKKINPVENFDIETRVQSSPCCDCGAKLDGAAGSATPSPGDLTLCIYCSGLNTFDDELKLRRPTEEEYLLAAANSEIQLMRQIVLQIIEANGEGKAMK